MPRLAAALALVALLAGCAGQRLEDYAAETPRLDLREYLDGPLQASGIFFGRSGRADLRFTVDMVGSWDGNTGTLEEDFVYSDGRTERRVWTLTFADDEAFTGTAHDVEGQAVGRQSGSAATMTYRLRLTREGGDEITVSMEDWFYLLEDGTLINRARMSKFGITVGELIVTFRKPAP
ncbi:DUF3833 domain-containing protein [Limibaculum sp. FT325]|uniref:DUF3833 domain-containing protein n=1 Tax=Thermohalobaculum sediminis TaxID=2939436 RepID=UPI0020BE9DE9|nr:DUF3833 domain-containing protein [Limibaculum sediminis]MCL5776546.1 DUF3833 domain-containing protein [Limibaculum sediminis]